MSQSYRALCTDYYVNQRINLKMDLPMRRDTVLSLFDRVRRELPEMEKFRRYQSELALESGGAGPSQQWLGIRKTSIRSGSVNPDSAEDGFRLHKLVLDAAPYFLDISPLDIDSLELLFGFDMLAPGNHDAIVYEALYAGSPIAEVVDAPGAVPIDFQPAFGVALGVGEGGGGEVHAHFEVKTRSARGGGKPGEFREDPISVYLTVRRHGPFSDLSELPGYLALLQSHGQDLLDSKVVPHLVVPIRNMIASGSA